MIIPKNLLNSGILYLLSTLQAFFSYRKYTNHVLVEEINMDNKENNTKERMSLPYYMGFEAKMLFRYSVTLVEMKR